MTRPRGRLARVIWSFLGAVLVLCASTAQAEAHNWLVSLTPIDGSTVSRTPAAVVLTFDQPVLATGTAITITDAGGTLRHEGAPRLVDRSVTQAIQPGAPAGTYTIRWRVTSADGHPIRGTSTFVARSAGSGSRAAGTEPVEAPSVSEPAVPKRSYGAWIGLLGVAAAAAVGLVLLRRSTDRRIAGRP